MHAGPQSKIVWRSVRNWRSTRHDRGNYCDRWPVLWTRLPRLYVVLAVDIHAISPLQSAWLQNNAYKFGWKTIAREPWHWQFYGGSTYGENA